MELSYLGEDLSGTITRDGQLFILGNMVAEVDNTVWITIDGRRQQAHVALSKDAWWVHFAGHTIRLDIVEAGFTASDSGGGLTAPMPGKVLEVLVKTGQNVTEGQALLVLEAMKMEHRILAPKDGEITAIHFNTGDQVTGGALLLDLQTE
ncbi:MAG: acetyl-CoA carboxylase biotin carboxyl carrier protein subunit [Candidatus Poseidoniales archaeon]|jgi:3-methylcrotonyl-CoA carboxylase alpha subunit|tara:strand:+ start:1554 stop:2003 length:450 start_codon:yes stop_codon:yes gene_type:complete